MSATEAEKLVDKEKTLEDFLVFFEDIYMELSKFGPLEALHVVDNMGDHMIGHVYAQFRDEEMASDALQVLQGRYYDGRVCNVEFSPVTDFREARCRDYDEGTCVRGGKFRTIQKMY
jgi:splicing factor U2AF subunit